MPTNIRIIHAHDFIKVNPEGHFNLGESKNALLEISAASAPLLDHEIIIDTRKAQLDLSVADLWYLAAELCNYRKSFSQKMAVLCPNEKFDHAEFFALCAQNRGFQVRAFTCFGDAIEWLITPVYLLGDVEKRAVR